MKRMAHHLLSSAFLFVLASALSGCKSDSVYYDVPYQVTFTNSSALDTHMWFRSGSCSPENKLAPGTNRTENFIEKSGYKGGPVQATLSVSAGRNGQTILTETVVVNGLVDNTRYIATFTEGIITFVKDENE